MRQTTFQGVVPKVRTEKLAPNFASNAENCLLHSGAIVPLKGLRRRGRTIDTLGKILTEAPESLYRIGDIDLGFTTFTAVAEDPLHIGADDAFLFVENGYLYRSNSRWLTDGEGPVPLGIDPPCTAPVPIALDTACPELELEPLCWAPPYSDDAECENTLAPQVIAFCYTWVTACAEESAPSPYSEAVLVPRGSSVVLSTLDTPPDNAVAIRWYMAVASKSEALMLYVGSSALPDETSFMVCPHEFAGDEALMTEGWHRMRCGEGVANVGMDTVLVWSGDRIYPSVPRQPHAYMDEDVLQLDWPIVRIVSVMSPSGAWFAVALTEGRPYIISREDPNTPPQVRVLNRMLPCMSPHGVIVVGDIVYYISATGVVMIAGGNASIITSSWFDTFAWQEVGGFGMTLGYYDQRLFVFAMDNTARGFMFPAPTQDNPYAKQDVVYLTHQVSALYTDVNEHMVVALVGGAGDAWFWEQGDTNMLALWECRTLTSAGVTHYTAAKVLTDAPRVPADAVDHLALLQSTLHRRPTAAEAKEYVRLHPSAAKFINELVGGYTAFSLICDKDNVFTRSVWNAYPFRLPRIRRSVEWGFSISTTAPVYEVHVDKSMNNLVQEGGEM